MRSSGARTAVLLATSILGACTVGPDFSRPALAARRWRSPHRLSRPGRDHARPARLVDGIRDPALDAIEARTLTGDLDIQEAGSRVQRSPAARWRRSWR